MPPHRFWRLPLGGLLFSLVAARARVGPAHAQQEPGCCVTQEGTDAFGHTPAYYDEAVTRSWLQNQQAADPRLMAQIAGTYYAEIPAPQLGMIGRQYRGYAPNGLFEYQDQTCSSTGCSQNHGHGRWVAHGIGGNAINLMISFSDLIRTNACVGGELRVDGLGFQAPQGTRWQRVR